MAHGRRTGADGDLTQGTLAYLNRQNYSFPPDHGARIVHDDPDDPELRADWMAELEEVRNTMLGLREQLADELRAADRIATASISSPITAACSLASARRPNRSRRGSATTTASTWSAISR